ncbi:MAG: GNAT family N-acetyltransferase [Faecousia sp.]
MLELVSPADRDGLNRLAGQLHSQHISWRPDLYTEAESLYSEDQLLQARNERQLYVAKIGGEIIGYIRLRMESVEGIGFRPRKRMLIEEFCVEECYRDQGFGTKMMQELRVLASAFRCDDLQLKVFPQNDEAVGFWQKCGFTIKTIEMQQSL